MALGPKGMVRFSAVLHHCLLALLLSAYLLPDTLTIILSYHYIIISFCLLFILLWALSMPNTMNCVCLYRIVLCILTA